jgi:DNA-binding transcriptional MerR regulator
MIQSEYWISELASLSGVSTRTIRYYIQEGLLPQPEIRGKYAVFTDEYMHRLRLIKYLKDAYLPLSKIKPLLDSLNDSQVVALLDEFEADPVIALANLQVLPVFNQESPNALYPEMVENGALKYIRQARGSRPLKEERIELNYSMPMPVEPARRPPTSEEWQRIVLLPGVELHIRQPVTTRVQRLVEKLVDLAGDFKSVSMEDKNK